MKYENVETEHRLNTTLASWVSVFLQIACSLYRTQLVVLYDLLHTGFHLCSSSSQQQVDHIFITDTDTDPDTLRDAAIDIITDTDLDNKNYPAWQSQALRLIYLCIHMMITKLVDAFWIFQ